MYINLCILGWQSIAYHFWVTVTSASTSDLVYRKWCISPVLFEVGKNQFLHEILGWQNVKYYPCITVTLTLTSDLYLESALTPVHISYILWGGNSKFGMWMHLGMAECNVPFSGHCDLDLKLSFYIIVSGAYVLYYLRLESQIWCARASWDGRVSCAINRGALRPYTWPLTYFWDKLCPEHISCIV